MPHVALLKFMDCVLDFQIRVSFHTHSERYIFEKLFQAILFNLRVFAGGSCRKQYFLSYFVLLKMSKLGSEPKSTFLKQKIPFFINKRIPFSKEGTFLTTFFVVAVIQQVVCWLIRRKARVQVPVQTSKRNTKKYANFLEKFHIFFGQKQTFSKSLLSKLFQPRFEGGLSSLPFAYNLYGVYGVLLLIC